MQPTTPRKRDLIAAKLSSLRRKIADLLRASKTTKGTSYNALKLVLRTTRDVADACNFSPLKGSLNILLDVLERCDLSGDVKEDLIAIVRKIEKMLAAFERYLSRGQEQEVVDFMASLTSTIDAVRASIEAKLDRGRIVRFLDAPDDAQDVVRLLRIIGDTADLFVMNINVDIASQVKRVLEELKLLELPFIGTAQYQAIANTGCTPGTRVGVNGNLLNWSTATADDTLPVCWVHGHAGVGKTTIMRTMSGILSQGGILGGSFFCSRDTADRRSITNIFPTVAQSLAIALPEFRAALTAALDGKKGVGSFTPDQQFDMLIATPARAALSKSKSKSPWRTRVVVIDALDECDDGGDATRRLLNILSRKAHGLGIRFLIASRPEPQFIYGFSGADRTWSNIFYMQDIPEEISREDVSRFLIFERSRCMKALPQRNWPAEDRLERLASQSGTLFIHAATAWKYISDINAISPSSRLEEVLALEPDPSQEHIDSVYRLVLSGLWSKQRSKRDLILTQRCLQAIICLYEPLSIQNLSLLLHIHVSHVQTVLDSLQSVIRVPHSDANEPVTTFHASFANYLLDPDRSGVCLWHINATGAHRELCLQCWQIMKLGLHLNISGSRSSYMSNDEQDEHPELSGALVYACLRWTDHLSKFEPSLADMETLEASFSAQFPFWLEVLSVVKRVQEGQRILSLLSQRMRKLLTDAPSHNAIVPAIRSEDSSMLGARAIMHSSSVNAARFQEQAVEIEAFSKEASQLLMAFAKPIAASAPHIYVSGLACMGDRILAKSPALAYFRRLPKIRTKQARRILPLLNFVGHDGGITYIAFSPDGKRLASVSNDHTIRMWDQDTGGQVGEPLRGHESSVNTIAFWPDGKRVVSGSDDGTIRMWDPDTGTQVGEPLRIHDGLVYTVAFSPDGQRFASGSDDGMIRIWDPNTGAQVGEPLRGHNGSVFSVSFSPDGKRVASASYDHTIRMWDPDTCTQIGKPLYRHYGPVNSVAFSPDGKRLASGSHDRTIRMWNPDTGIQVGEPLCGHDGSVTSVAFSPDGKRVVSGSGDGTIRLWNPNICTGIAEPLRGHDGPVHSVAFSPDGKRVASGSRDGTMRMWDPDAGTQVSEPLPGHNSPVSSVSFSPDGRRIASGSYDRTIRMWNPDEGTQVGEPLRGHDGPVNSVAFSPDGKRVVSASHDRTVRMWDPNTGVQVGEPLRGHDDLVYSVAFSPDGKRVASGSRDGTIRIWDPNTGVQVGEPLHGHDGSVNSVAFSPDGKRVVSGSDDDTIRMWDPDTGTQVGEPLRGHDDLVRSVAFSPDGKRIASGSNDGTIRMWDVDTCTQVGEPLRGHDGPVNSVAFSPDGKCVVSASHDGTIRMWDFDTYTQIGEPLRGHHDWVTCVAFRPNSKHVASGSDEGTIRLWDPNICTQVGTPQHGHDNPVYSPAFLPDHRRISPTSQDQAIWLRGTSQNSVWPGGLSPVDNFGLANRPSFTLDKSGWLRGPNKELIFWVLPEYRHGLWWPDTNAVLGVHPVNLNLAECSLGKNWTDLNRSLDANAPSSIDK